MMAAQESKLQEYTADLQIAREGRDVISVSYMKTSVGNVVSHADGMKNI